MSKSIILVIFIISAIGCRTTIIPAIRTPARSSIELVESAEEPAVKQYEKVFPLLTDQQSRELRDRFDRHQTEAMDIEIVSYNEYQCKSDWICPEDAGAWICYCKAEKVVEEP